MSTDAISMARRYYGRHGRNMERDLAALRANPHSFVLLHPRLVALLKPVHRTSAAAWPDLLHSPADADAWYVHLLCGDLPLAGETALSLRPLPWFVFQRGARSAAWHIHPRERLVSLLLHCNKPSRKEITPWDLSER